MANDSHEVKHAMEFWSGAENMPVMALVARGILVYTYLLVLTKLMGKRELGRLSAFDFIASVILGSVGAATLVDPQLSLTPAFVTLATVAALETCAALLSLKFPVVRTVLEGNPTQLVRSGQILRGGMRRARVNLSDLMSQLRQNGITSWSEIQDIFLEPSGKVSVLKQAAHLPVTAQQLGIPVPRAGTMLILVEDGHIMTANLKSAGYTVETLEQKLRADGLGTPHQAAAVLLDGSGRLHVSQR